MKKFWLVWCIDGGAPTFQHPGRHHAEREAERLARNNPGKTFVVLESVAAAKKADVAWLNITDETQPPDEREIPF